MLHLLLPCILCYCKNMNFPPSSFFLLTAYHQITAQKVRHLGLPTSSHALTLPWLLPPQRVLPPAFSVSIISSKYSAHFKFNTHSLPDSWVNKALYSCENYCLPLDPHHTTHQSLSLLTGCALNKLQLWKSVINRRYPPLKIASI